MSFHKLRQSFSETYQVTRPVCAEDTGHGPVSYLISVCSEFHDSTQSQGNKSGIGNPFAILGSIRVMTGGVRKPVCMQDKRLPAGLAPISGRFHFSHPLYSMCIVPGCDNVDEGPDYSTGPDLTLYNDRGRPRRSI